MYCNRCASEAIKTQANFKEYYYCRSCKDEVFIPVTNLVPDSEADYRKIDKFVFEQLDHSSHKNWVHFIRYI